MPTTIPPEECIELALAQVKKRKPKSELEASLLAPIVALLTDAAAHLERIPAVLETHAKERAILDAQRALDAAQAAQRG